MKSNIINQYFDHVFVISTVENTGRQKRITDYLDSLGIKYNLRIAPPKEYFEGKPCEGFILYWDPVAWLHPGATSLKLCYLSIFAECVYRGIDKLLILEDDIIFENDYETKFDVFMKHVPNEWELLNIGHHGSKTSSWKFEPIDEYVSLCEYAYASHIVAIQGKKTLTRLINKFRTDQAPVDFVFGYFTHALKLDLFKSDSEPFMKSYIPNEIICRQQSYRHDCKSGVDNPDVMFKSLIG
jgi:hypothetical protein